MFVYNVTDEPLSFWFDLRMITLAPGEVFGLPHIDVEKTAAIASLVRAGQLEILETDIFPNYSFNINLEPLQTPSKAPETTTIFKKVRFKGNYNGNL